MFDTTQHVIFTQFTTSLWQLVNSSKIAQMKAAIAYLDVQDQPNYVAAARLYKLAPSTLTWRYQDISVSRTEATSTHHQRLNNVQEDTLLGYIDVLTDRHMPSITQIIKNLAEGIVRGELGQNWTTRFIKRNSQRVCSLYLRVLDRTRTSAESVSLFEHFY